MLSLYVNLAGISLIILILWWFILYRPKAKAASGERIDIYVKDGVYDPSYIKIPKGKQVILRFHRIDTSPCAEVVLFESLDINAKLPLNDVYEIPLSVDTPGEHEFTCQMQMYKGTILVE